MRRREIKEKIASFVATIDGVNEVYPGQPKDINRFPAVVVRLPASEETAPTMPRGVGRKTIQYRARLDVVDLNPTENAVTSELAFDELVDRIVNVIRENYTLGGAVFSAGTQYIRVEVADPQLAGKSLGSVFRLATIEFDVVDYVIG